MAISLERSQVLRFGVFEVDPRARELRRQGIRIRLQEQPLQVLLLLLEHAGDVVTRDELRQQLWPSSVYVDFDHGLNNAIARLREALGDAAATPHFIETLPRLGYRFIYPLGTPIENTPAPPLTEPVAPRSGSATDAVPKTESASAPSRVAPSRGALAAGILAAVVLLALSLGVWLTRQSADPVAEVSLAKQPSIAVLPFINMSSDEESEHFADGLSEEIAIKLAGIRGLTVIGRTSSSYFKGKRESLAFMAQTLKASHLLDGSVRRSGTRLRITAQLIDAAEGSAIWSQTFDRNLTNIFEIQEEIAFAVATALHVNLLDTDEQRLRKRGTQDAEAYRLYVVANAHVTGVSVTKDAATGKRLFELAIARDPTFAAAYGGLARYHFERAWNTLADVEDGVPSGLLAAQRAVALDPESSEALRARANFAMWRYRFLDDFAAYAQAQDDFRRAIELDPSNETVIFDYGRAVLWLEPDLAHDLFERVVELEPVARVVQGMNATTLNIRGQHDVARKRLQELRARTSDRRSLGITAIHLAGVETYLGHLDEAVVLAREGLTRDGLGPHVWLWGLYMSLGDLGAARTALAFGDTELAEALREAAGLMMDGRYDDAFDALERQRVEFEGSRILDLPTARLGLIAGKPEQALAIITQRLPDLVAGVEPINGRSVIPALDLATAWKAADEHAQSRQLLDRIAGFLDGPAAPRLPMFTYQRARAHALNGESELALQALDRAYADGFRTTWALDLHPQPILYIDPIEVDPAFTQLRTNPRYEGWLARVKDDNARQLERLRARVVTKPLT